MSVNESIFAARSEIVLGIGHQSYRQLCSDSPRPMSADYVVLTQLDLGESNALCFSLSSPLSPLKRLCHQVIEVFRGGWKFYTNITICWRILRLWNWQHNIIVFAVFLRLHWPGTKDLKMCTSSCPEVWQCCETRDGQLENLFVYWPPLDGPPVHN